MEACGHPLRTGCTANSPALALPKALVPAPQCSHCVLESSQPHNLPWGGGGSCTGVGEGQCWEVACRCFCVSPSQKSVHPSLGYMQGKTMDRHSGPKCPGKQWATPSVCPCRLQGTQALPSALDWWKPTRSSGPGLWPGSSAGGGSRRAFSRRGRTSLRQLAPPGTDLCRDPWTQNGVRPEGPAQHSGAGGEGTLGILPPSPGKVHTLPALRLPPMALPFL